MKENKKFQNMEFWNGDEGSEMYTLQNEGWCVNGMDYTVYAHGYMHLPEDGGFIFFPSQRD